MATEITIKCVEGNPLAINVVMTAIEHSMLNGEMVTETVDFYPDTTKPVRAVLDCTTARRQYCPQTSVSDNVVYVSDNGSIAAGVYTLTITCTDTQGKKRRYKSDPCIEVYDATSAAEIAATFDSQTYELNGVFYTFAGGGGTVQADWDETDPNAPSYIQNKPDLSEYATDEELQAVEESIPDVPAWALQPQKPTYTATEVGAVPTIRTVNGKALSQDITLNANDVGAQPTIQDLSEIRSGAAKGATAYQKPSGGIPSSDMESAVQTALTSAGNAIPSSQKGAANGVATLGSDGKVPSSQLPSYVDGVGIASVVQTTTSTEDGGTNVITVTKTDNTTSTFSVKNGSKGSIGATGPQGERGPQGNTGVTVESVNSIIHSIDPTATYAAADVAGADAVQDVLSEVTELAGNIYTNTTASNTYIAGDTKVWGKNNGYYCRLIPITAGSTYWITAGTGNAQYTFLTSNNYTQGSAVSTWATGYTNQLPSAAPGTSVQVTAPSDAQYLYILCSTNGTDRNHTVQKVVSKFDGIGTRLDEIENKVGTLEEDSTAPIEDEIDLNTKIAAGKYGFWGGIWRSNSQHSGWFIPISGESIRVVAGNGLVYCIFCSGTTQTANTASSYVSGPFSIQSGDTWEYDIPENATYLWCNINAIDRKVLPSEVYCIRRYGLNNYSQKIEPKLSYLNSKVGTIEDIGDTIGNNDTLVRTFNGIVFYNKDDNELYIRSLTTGTWIYKDVECLKNPIIEENSPDASIIVVNGVYYAFTTRSTVVFKSTDFVHWETISYSIVPESYTGSKWAPDVDYLSDKYVIYLTYNGNSLLILSSDTILPENRYTVEANLNLGSIDYCYYNGYLFYGSGTVYRRTMTDYKTPADDAVTLSGPSGEGPMLWHNGDYYYMFTSTPVSQSYQYDVKVYRASSLTATTWETKGKILGSTSSSEVLNGPGHVSEVLQDADGRYFMMMQIHVYNSGWTYRPTIIQEFRMNSNGWPEFIDATGNVITKPSIMCRKPKLPLTVLK